MALPDGFVYLKEINPRIVPNLRYFSHENFVGSRISGYHANEVILTRQAAEALSKAQEKFEQDGNTIVVYDAYRPKKAVHFIINWLEDPNDDSQRPKYYPNRSKHDILELGFFNKNSSHSRGSTVDLTIMKIGNSIKHSRWINRRLLDGQEILYHDDDTVDMGTSYDYLDEASYHDSSVVPREFNDRRDYLKNVMKSCGFNEYHKEWWHYTLANEPFPTTYFDFDVETAPNKQ